MSKAGLLGPGSSSVMREVPVAGARYGGGVLDGSHVRSAARACADLLSAHVDGDWSAAAPEMTMTVAGVVGHAAEGCLWYAIDLSAGGKDLRLIQHSVAPDAAPPDLIAAMTTEAAVLAAVVDAAPPDARGFHPMGLADASGFAAMGCDELLVHTDDAARGLRAGFDPPKELAEAVLRRLFPWAPVDGDPWQLLLWANGRIALGDRPRLERWRWHCAPLDEWDGRAPAGLPAG
jgi:Mycothiol maleylpyruvate isomerase N-terminal domain